MTNFLSRLRVRVIFFVLIAALPAFALTLYSGLEIRKQVGLEAQDEALRLVRLAAVNQEFLIQNTQGMLVALAHPVGVRDEGLSTCGTVFSHLQDSHFPYYLAFYIADIEGNILCNISNSQSRLNSSIVNIFKPCFNQMSSSSVNITSARIQAKLSSLWGQLYEIPRSRCWDRI